MLIAKRGTNLIKSNLACDSVLVTYDKKNHKLQQEINLINLFLTCDSNFIAYKSNSTSYGRNLISYLYLTQFIKQKIPNLFPENLDKWINRILGEYYAK